MEKKKKKKKTKKHGTKKMPGVLDRIRGSMVGEKKKKHGAMYGKKKGR